MNKLVAAVFGCLISAFLVPVAQAAPDQYPGDSSIYGVQSPLQPNVMIFIDNSGSMADVIPGGDYAPGTSYPVVNKCASSSGVANQACSANAVYSVSTSTDSYGNVTLTGDSFVNASYNNVITSCTTLNPRNLLATTGQYSGRALLSGGTSCSTTKGNNGMYYTGNYINYLYAPGTADLPKYVIAQSVISNLISSSSNVKFGLMTFYYPSGSTPKGATFLSVAPSWTATPYVTNIQKMGSNFPSGLPGHTNRDALLNAITTLSPTGSTALSEALFEVGQYFSSGKPAYGATFGTSGGVYSPSPIDAPCQNNYIIFVTDGASNSEVNSTVTGLTNNLSNICPTSPCPSGTPFAAGNADCCGVNDVNSVANGGPGGYPVDGLNNALADVARYLNTGTNNIVTYTVGFGLEGAGPAAVNLLAQAADSTHGKGKSYLATNQTSLNLAFSQIMSNIYSINSSFVAPVVPVSPQNRTFGGSRVYMGFFKPNNNTYWNGNLKKYGIDLNNNITDVNASYATWVDISPVNGVDDLTGVSLPAGSVNGSFKTAAQSFWSSSADAGNVTVGGAGSVLQGTAAASRTIYTATTTAGVTSIVPFDTSNVTPAMLGYAATDTTSQTNLINFIKGQDAYNSSGTGNTTANRSWLMGDVLHSRPLVINYSSYVFTAANEKSCTTNTALIYVGGNDGMLHAIKDCDGTEAWAFIPPDLLDNLQAINGVQHSYFVDSTPVAYVYNKLNDGNINTVNGDKVVLLFGERRGGGVATAPTTGSYYALDVSHPASPAFLWTLSNTAPTVSGSAVFPELSESWSEPKIVKMNISGIDKIVAFFGAGYDNPNEDGRYGVTQNFTGTANGTAASLTGSGNVTSSPGSGTAPYSVSPTGRGIYAVQVATLSSSGVPTIATSATKIWSYTNASNAALNYSFPSQITAVSSKNNGYTDRLYAGDTGGNLWRFDVGNTSTASWTGTKIFSSNPGALATDTGRKIFYAPSVVQEVGYFMIFFGTGDREHPLNTAVTDRMYALVDPYPTGLSTTLTESKLVDVTADLLQSTTVAGDASVTNSVANLLGKLTFNPLNASTNYGWYIQLNALGANSGEKVLASPMIFNKVAYFNTYAPNSSTSAASCTANLGVAYQYALNYKTGEAVLDFDTSNDNTVIANNTRYLNASGQVVARSDRVQTIGTGIPSGLVVFIDPNGKLKSLTGVGGAIAGGVMPPGGASLPLYWRQK
jgi:type IV pilus assembly protein PilY1